MIHSELDNAANFDYTLMCFVPCRNLLNFAHNTFVVFVAFHDRTSDKSFNLNLFISDKLYLQNVSHNIRECQNSIWYGS